MNSCLCELFVLAGMQKREEDNRKERVPLVEK